VLEDSRPGQRAVLGHVADQEDGSAAGLGVDHEPSRRLPHLAYRPGGARDIGGKQRLHAVHHGDGGPVHLHGVEDAVQVGLRQHRKAGWRPPQSIGPHPNLPSRLFAGYVQDLAAGPGEGLEYLEEQRGLADARIASHENR
jgi:hypothetical protein